MNPFICTLLLFGLLIASGCASRSSYERLRAEAASGTSVNPWDATSDTGVEVDTPAPSATKIADTQAEIQVIKDRWRKILESDASSNRKSAFLPLDLAPFRLTEAQLDARLAKAVDLPFLIGVLATRNPAVLSTGTSARAALTRYSQASQLDDVLSQYNAFTKQLNTKMSNQRQKEMMAMRFPFPDTLALKGQIVDEDVAIAIETHEISIRDAIANLREAYYSLVFVEQAIVINNESRELLSQMIEVAQAKIRGGKGNSNAVIMAQVELSKQSDAIITLEEQRQTFLARINTLLNRPPDAKIGVLAAVKDVDLAASLDELYLLVIANQQELRQQHRKIVRMELMIELATRMAYPDATLGASYFEDRMRLSSGTGIAPPAFSTGPDADHTQAASFGQRDAYVREVRVQIKAMQQMLTAMEDKARFVVKTRHFGLATARRSIDLYTHTLLPQAQQAVDATAGSYRSGNSDFLTFLDAERTWLKFRLEKQRALRDFRVHLARLESIVGLPLPTQAFVISQEKEDKQ